MAHLVRCQESRSLGFLKAIIVSKLRYIRKCAMSEPMLHTEVLCSMSELMLHMKMCNARTYVTREYEICSVRTYVAYENVIFPNLCYERKKWCLVSARPRAAEYTIGICKEKAKKPNFPNDWYRLDPSVNTSFIISVGNLSFWNQGGHRLF